MEDLVKSAHGDDERTEKRWYGVYGQRTRLKTPKTYAAAKDKTAEVVEEMRN